MSVPKISIIVPVYNAAEFLQKCIDSIQAQTFQDFEIILINDGSKDNSAAICDDNARADSRIKVYHQPNSGVSAARNRGLEAAQGEWIVFIDSDDHVYPHYLEDMYTEAIESGCDIVISGCEYDSYLGHGEVRRPDVRIDEGQMPDFFFKYKGHTPTCVWGKIYRRSLVIGKVKFDEEIGFCEDAIFNFECFMLTSGISMISKINYYYLMHPNSLSHFINVFDCEYRIYQLYNEMQQKLETRFPGHDFSSVLDSSLYLKRAIYSLYNGMHPKAERMSRLRSLKFDPKRLRFSAAGHKERIYNWAIKHRLWHIVDFISDRTVLKMEIPFKEGTKFYE